MVARILRSRSPMKRHLPTNIHASPPSAALSVTIARLLKSSWRATGMHSSAGRVDKSAECYRYAGVIGTFHESHEPFWNPNAPKKPKKQVDVDQPQKYERISG